MSNKMCMGFDCYETATWRTPGNLVPFYYYCDTHKEADEFQSPQRRGKYERVNPDGSPRPEDEKAGGEAEANP